MFNKVEYKKTKSYIFNESIERIYKIYTTPTIFLEILYKNYITNYKIIKGEKFDEEGTIFSFRWKDYYNIDIIVENFIKTPYYKSYKLRSIKIDICPFILFTIEHKFYYSTIDNKTIFILAIKINDSFFSNLIDDEFSENDITLILKRVEKFAKTINNDLNFSFSCVINLSLLDLWPQFINPLNFWNKIQDNVVPICKDSILNSESEVNFCMKDKNKNNVNLISMGINKLVFSDRYALISFYPKKATEIPPHILSFSFFELKKNKTFLCIKINLIKYVNNEYKMFLESFWKKRLNYIYKYFNKNKES